jgi:hypothetical protein
LGQTVVQLHTGVHSSTHLIMVLWFHFCILNCVMVSLKRMGLCNTFVYFMSVANDTEF